jgi:ATP-binding cassette subfamily B protein
MTGKERDSFPTWKAMWGVIRFQPWRYAFTTLARSIDSLGWLIPGLVGREFFNLITDGARARFDLWTLIAFLVAGGLSHIVGAFSRIQIDVRFNGYARTLLHKHMLGNVLQQPGGQALPESPGEAISRFQGDVDEFSQAILLSSDLLANLLFTGAAVFILISVSPLITLAAFVPLVAVVAIASVATQRVQRYRKVVRESSGAVAGFISEAFNAVQAVQVANAEKRLVERFVLLNEERRKAALKDRLFTEILDSIMRHSGNVGIGIVLLLAPPLFQASQVTIGDLTLFVYYLGMLTMFVSGVGTFWARYTQAGVSVSRMLRLLQGAPPETLVEPVPVHLRGPLPDVPYVHKSADHRLDELAVKNLRFCYPDSQRGIEGITMKIQRGAFVVITGRVGSGKTTLLRTLLGLLPQQGGEIYWNGEQVEDAASFFAPPRSAYTAQVPRLFSATLQENILLGLPQEKTDINGALRAAVLERDILELEDGLDTMVGTRGVKLSGGQAQRAAAARMFARDPELLVFDDLSSALDVETEQALWERLFSRRDADPARAFTCLVVSHRRAALQHADHVIVLKDGKVCAEGRVEDLLESCDEMKRLWAGEASP